MRVGLLASLLAVMFLSHANAQTMGYADAVRVLANACGEDIRRHCADAPLANWGIGACLDENRASISQGCASAAIEVRNAIDAREAAQAGAERVCSADIARLCSLSKPGRGHILQCMLKAEPSVSKRCNQAITDAGWR